MKKKFLIWTLTICVALQAFPMSAAAAMPESTPESATVSESEVPSEQSSVPEGSSISEPESGDTAETDPLSDKQESSEPEAAPVPETPEQENTDEETQDPLLPEVQTDPEETAEAQVGTETAEETQTETEVTEETEDISVSGNDPSSLSAAQEPLMFVTAGNTGVIQTGSLDTFSSSDYGIMSVSTDFEDAMSHVAEQLHKRVSSISLKGYRIPLNQMNIFHAALFNEHPELYFVDTAIRYSYDPQSNTLISMQVSYLDGYDNMAFDAAVAQALSLLEPSMDDAQKALVLHDYLATQCKYDYANFLQGTIPADSYNAYGPLVLHTAVCQGYALAYKYLLNLAGIDCLMVTSQAMNHAWNLVGLDGEYYQTDVTWDDPVWDRLGRCMHSHLLVSDARLTELEHHDWTIQRNGKEVNLTATDTRYESSAWYESSAQVLIKDGYAWYLLSLNGGYSSRQPGAIYRMDLASDRTECIYTFEGYWPSWDSPNSYYTDAYSGLEWIDGRLFFNTPTEIRSIAPDGTDLRQECRPDTSAGYLYGIARQGAYLKYCIEQTPGVNGDEDVYIADLSEEIQTPVYYVLLSPPEITLRAEESAVLDVTVYPEGADPKTLSWQSSAPEVAEASDGTVHALSAGNAVITATTPSGASASCSVTVLPPIYTVTFYDRDGNVLKELTEVEGGTDLTALAPAPPEGADGYAFTGWDQPLDKILSDLNVYPLYEPILYSITYELNGGTLTENNPDSYTVESGTIVLHSPVRDDCFFDGWYTDKDFSNPIKQIETGSFGNLTLYAAWHQQLPDNLVIGAVPQLDQTLSGIPVSLPVGWEWATPGAKLASFTGSHSKLFSVVRRVPITHEEIYGIVKVVFLTVEDLEIRRQDGSLLSSDDALPELLPGESEDFLCSYHWSDDALYAQREASPIRISASAQPSNVLLASASLQGDDAFRLTAKKAGTAAVTVTVTGDLPSSPGRKTVSVPLLQKKISFRIPNPQTDEKAEVSIRLLDENGQALTPNQDGQYELASGAVCYVQDDTPAKADGKSYSIQYKVSDTALLKLSAVASDKTRKKLTAAKPGIAVLTAQANDKRKSGVSLTIRVISTDISISSSSADICLLSENPAATLTVYNGYGAGLTDAKLTAADGSPATGFLLQDFSPDGAIQIGLEKGNTKGGKLLLTVTMDDGLQNPWSTTEKAFPITIRVNSKKPAVTVKQSKKVNTFLEEEDAWGLLSVGAAGEVIESVQIKETDPKAFGYEFDEVSGALKVRPGGDISKKTGTLLIKLAGYADPLEKTFTVSTESVSHKLSAASAVFYPGDSRDIRIQMLEKSTGRAVDLTGASVTAALPRTGEALPSGQYNFAVTEDGTAIRITALADPASLPASTKLKLTVSNPDAWHESRTFDFTVKTADLSKAALQLGSKTLTLYEYIGQDGASTVSTPLTLTGGYSPVDILEQTAISGANSASLSALGKTLSVEYEKENSRIVVRTIGEKVPAGSYKFNLTLQDPSVAKEWKTALTVKVVSVDANSSNQKNRPGVKISASGSIDLLNRANTYVTLTPKFTNVAADAVIAKENIRLTGPNAHLFEIAWQKGNAVAIRLKPEAVAVTKYAYQVKAIYTLTSCNVPLQVTSNAVNIKLKQGKPQISAKGGTVFSNTKTEETKLTFLALNSAKKELVIEKVELLNDTGEFSYDLETGTLTHTPAGKTASNKSYKLKFQIILKDAADNEKPISVTYTVKLLKF